jgi:hypothetical protein
VNSRNTIIAIIATLSASLAFTDDFKTINGKEYKNVTVSRVEADGIVIKGKSGISKVYFVELPKGVQQRFGYDATKLAKEAAELRKQQEVADLMKEAESALRGHNFAYTAALFNQITQEYPVSPQAEPQFSRKLEKREDTRRVEISGVNHFRRTFELRGTWRKVRRIIDRYLVSAGDQFSPDFGPQVASKTPGGPCEGLSAPSPDRLDRFGCESKKAFGIGEKRAALLCQRDQLLCAIEKPDAKLFFQILNLPRE